MSITIRRQARVLLVVVVLLSTVALSGRHAEAQVEYYVAQEALTFIPKSWAGSVAWASQVSGGSMASGATAIGAGTFGAAVVGAAAVGGYVGWAIYEGSLTPWDIDDPEPATEGWGNTYGGTDHAWLFYLNDYTYVSTDSGDGSYIINVGWETNPATAVQYRLQCIRADGSTLTGSGWTSDAWKIMSYDCGFDDGQPRTPWRVQLRENNTSTGYEEVYFSQHAEADRRIDVTGTCTDPVTGGTRTVSASTGEYIAGQEPAVPGVQCGPGEILTEVTVKRVMTETGDTLDLLDYATPAGLTDGTSDYAECFESAATGNPCELMVYRVDGTTRYDCNTYEGLCAEWASDPDRETLYECRYGQYTPGDTDPVASMPHVLPLSDCFFLERAFDAGTEGELVEDAPDSTTQQPAPDSNLFKNALRWAFVPSGTTTSAMADLRTDLETRTPVQQLTAVSTYFGQVGADLSDSEVCWQVTANLTTAVLDGGDQAVVDTCGGNVVYETLVGWRPVLAFLMYGVLFVPLGWWAWKQYAPGSQGVA